VQPRPAHLRRTQAGRHRTLVRAALAQAPSKRRKCTRAAP
jgi:hypothetical protein